MTRVRIANLSKKHEIPFPPLARQPIEIERIRDLGSIAGEIRNPISLLSGIGAKSGEDNFQVDVQTTRGFDMAIPIRVPTSTAGAACTLGTVPNRGVTGNIVVTVKWSCPVGGVLQYKLRIYGRNDPVPSSPSGANGSAPTPHEVIRLIDTQSIERLTAALQSMKRVTFIIEGADALKLFPVLPEGGTFAIPGTTSMVVGGGIGETALILAILAAAGVGALAIAAMTVIVVTGIALGYRIEWDMDVGSLMPFRLPKLVFELVPPS